MERVPKTAIAAALVLLFSAPAEARRGNPPRNDEIVEIFRGYQLQRWAWETECKKRGSCYKIDLSQVGGRRFMANRTSSLARRLERESRMSEAQKAGVDMRMAVRERRRRFRGRVMQALATGSFVAGAVK